MPRVLAPVVPLLVATVATLTLLSGCTSGSTVAASPGPSTPNSSGTASMAPASSAPPSSASPTSSGTTPGASASSSAPADADVVTINIRIADGQVSPNGSKVNVAKGQTVILEVTSDVDDEIHAHTAGDGYELEVEAGKPATGRLVASDSGSFEVESHHLEKIIAVLVVR